MTGMESIPLWLEAAAMRQDYLWFLLIVGWIALLTLDRAGRIPGLRILGIVVIAQAGAELLGTLLFADSTGEPALRAEWVLSMVAALTPLGWFAMGGSRRWGWRLGLLLAFLGLSVLAVLLGFRRVQPLGFTAGAAGLALALGLLGLRWLSPVPRWWWLAGVLSACAPLFATGGLLAELLGWPRRWLTISPLGLPATGWQLLIFMVAAASWRERARAEPGGVLASGGTRLILGLLAGWLLLGAFLVEVAGRGASQTFVAVIQARTRTCLTTLDRAGLAFCLGPQFRLDRVRPGRNPAWKMWAADSSSLRDPGFQPHRDQLHQLQAANPDLDLIFLTTLRQGWLATVVFPTLPEAIRARANIALWNEITPQDRARWADKTGYVEGPAWSPRGTFLTVAEPLLAPDGRMLGWLTVKIDSHRVLAAQMPARLLMGLTVAMGSVIAVGFLLVRARGQAQREEAARASAALAADRMKSALLAHVSHELRTPLQGILGYAELLAGRPLDEEQRGWVSAQRRQGELLQRLVNDLIDLGALQSGAFTFAARSVPLTSLVEESVLSLRPRAHIRQLTLDLDADPTVPAWLVCDPDRVRQVLLNLVGNAIKFTGEGGVVVNLRLVTADAFAALVEIAVADTGPGIAPADQARLFRPFTRLEGTLHHEGAGLGLALAHGLCVGMGGSLTVESDGRTGTTFRARLTLPLGSPPPGVGDPVVTPVKAHAGVTIVVADDNTLVRELYLAHLSAQGATCTGVADGVAAVTTILAAQPPVDVLVLDLAMPQLDGLAVARRVRAEGPAGLRIIGASAHGNPEHRQRALAAGMDDFLVKPVKLSELSRCVQRQLGREAPLVGGSQLPEALRWKLRDIYQQETPALLAALDAALASNDWATLESRAHYLKNSAHVLGEVDLAVQCEAIVLAARVQDPAPISARLAAIRTQIGQPGAPES